MADDSVQTGKNIASVTLAWADETPDRVALIAPLAWSRHSVTDAEQATFAEFRDRTATLQKGLIRAGIGPGARVLMLVPISIDFYATVLAVLATGAIAVLVDPGMGLRRIRRATASMSPDALVGVPRALVLATVVPEFRRIPLHLGTESGIGKRKPALRDLAGLGPAELTIVPRRSRDHALVTFTTGSTGAPKGADRTHGILLGQHRALKKEYPSAPGDVEMTAFPVLASQTIGLGATTVLPPVDFRAVGSVVPEVALEWMSRHGVTGMWGSPAFLAPIALKAQADGGNRTVRAVRTGGAPVSVSVSRNVLAAFPEALCTIVYGSTEAEPIAHTTMNRFLDLVEQGHGPGYFVGPPVEDVEVKLVNLPRPLPGLGERGLDPYEATAGQWGEVAVRGSNVIERYWENPAADSETKLPDLQGRTWHLTGDIARVADGGLWLGGRVADTVDRPGTAVNPYSVERAVDEIEGVARSALISHSAAPFGELLVQPATDAPRDTLDKARRLLDEMDLAGVPTSPVTTLPLDSRHNAKIDRPTLRRERESLAAARLLHPLPERPSVAVVKRLPNRWRDALVRKAYQAADSISAR